MSTAHDILIVGGGSVGLATAAALVAEGFKPKLLDAGALPPPAPVAGDAPDARVYALSTPSMRFLSDVGALPDASRQGCVQRMHIWHQDAARGLEFAAPPGEALSHITEQRALNAALLACLPPKLLGYGQAVTHAQAEEGAVAVTTADGQTHQGQLLVIADGPGSGLRAQLGFAAQWSADYAQTALVSHVRFAQPAAGVAYQRFLPGGPIALLPMADGRASLVWSLPNAEAERLMALPDAEFLAALEAATAGVLGAAQAATPRRGFGLTAQWLASPARAGVAVVGDAAHVVHPLAGQGLNLGLGDAQVLAKVLGEAKRAGRSWWRLRTLARYVRLREAPTLEVLGLTHALHHGFAGRAQALSALLGEGLSLLQQVPVAKQMLMQAAQR